MRFMLPAPSCEVSRAGSVLVGRRGPSKAVHSTGLSLFRGLITYPSSCLSGAWGGWSGSMNVRAETRILSTSPLPSSSAYLKVSQVHIFLISSSTVKQVDSHQVQGKFRKDQESVQMMAGRELLLAPTSSLCSTFREYHSYHPSH